MANLRIPERFRAGIALVGRLSEESFHHIVEALKADGSGVTTADLAAKIESKVPGVPLQDVKAIISAISAMQAVKKSSHANAALMTSDIWTALQDDSPELADGIDEELLKTRMSVLLNNTSIYLTSSKIAELRSEVERSFCGARVLTDIRTAFPDDTTKTPATTILHTLEIMFHDDIGRHREFYVSMDDNDLIVLKEAVERAMQKKSTLSELLKKTEFEMFD